MNSPLLTPHSKMVLYKGRTKHSLLLQDPCLMSMRRPKDFGRRQSTPHVMLLIGSIYTGCLRRLPMNYSLEGSQMYHTSGSLDASAKSTRRDNISASSKEDVILDS